MPQLDPDRWRAASLRLDEALELPEGDRASWLDALRDQDPTLADDVRGLLEEYEVIRRQRFLEGDYAFDHTPAADDHGGPAGVSRFEGRTFGAYRLVSPIGHGGMGVVWLAERCDGRFEARVAVKLLDVARFGRSEAQIRREATILARVTHPNIAHLIDGGISPDGQPYLVLELIDGQPIDRYCDDRQLDVPSRIALFLDVLGAVAHAHSHRIVHRDIKPSNVLVRADGHVKLLDFGIAKLLEDDGQSSKLTSLTLEHGTALTPAFAAPEQLAGGPVTIATDVYALGVLLYLLLTGHHSCGDANSPADLFRAIVDAETPPPSTVVLGGTAPGTDRVALAASRATTPERLHRRLMGDLDTIVLKALKKAPQERYASVGDLADDLRRHLASQPIRARPDSAIRRTTRFVSQHAGLTAVGGVTVLIVSVAAGFYAIRPAPESSPGLGPESKVPVLLTTEAGDEMWPSFSPDGTRVAFSSKPAGVPNSHIAIKTLGTDAVVRLTDSTAQDVSPIWSPDGRQIAFVRVFREPEPRADVCLIPLTGGTPRVLHTQPVHLPGLAWWHAGNALLFATRHSTSEAFRLAALDLTTLDLRLLTKPPAAPLLVSPGDSLPAVSPDGRMLAFVRETHEGRDVFLFDPVTFVEHRLTHDRHRITGLTWASDGRGVIITSARSGVDALYRVALADGSILRVPQTGDGATHPMADRGGLVFSQRHEDSNIYRVDLRNVRTLGPARSLIASSRADTAPHISPGGQNIAFLSTRGGGQDIWVASADGANPRRLTSLPITSGPRWSPDGRSIAFGAFAPGQARPDIWIVDVGGGTPKRLTVDPSYETILSWAADGTSLYFISDRGGAFEVWTMAIRGGVATQVTKGGGLRAQESADGRFLYYANDVPEVWRRPLRPPSAESLIITFPKGTNWGGDWIAGARGLYYISEHPPGPAGIDYLPFGADHQRAIRLVSFTAPAGSGVSSFAVSPDESWLVWAQDDYRNTDIMMVPQR
jgi:Tol biopolymer transport system component/serine/threonine protein kinase